MTITASDMDTAAPVVDELDEAGLSSSEFPGGVGADLDTESTVTTGVEAAFLTAQEEVDILFMGNNAGSDQWDEVEMEAFILENTLIPTGSINDWMAPYSLLTLAKSAKEQGVWAAQTALSILDGMEISQISVAENKKGELIVNLGLADKLGVVFAPSLLKNAVIIGD